MASFQWLCNLKDPEGQVAQWLEAIQELDCKIIHRKGRSHSNTDALSRIPCRQCGQVLDEDTDTSTAATTITGSAVVDIKRHQRDDPIIGSLIEAKTNQAPPPKGHQGKEAKRLIQLWDLLYFNCIVELHHPVDHQIMTSL